MTVSSGLGGTAPEFDPEAALIGIALLQLQAAASAPEQQPGWVNRRVDQLEFIDTRAVRWQVSIDFNVPEGAPAHPGDKEFSLVPIASLAKVALVKFSLRDEESAAVWMPTARETAHYLASALAYWASQALKIVPKELPPALTQDLERIVSGDPREFRSRPPILLAAAALIDANRRYRRAVRNYKKTRPQREGGTGLFPLRRWYERQLQCEHAERELGAATEAQHQATQGFRGVSADICQHAYRLMASRDFRNRVEELARNFVVHVGITSPLGTRRIIKLGYEARAPFRRPREWLWRFSQSLGWRCWQLDVLFGGRGGSYHLEVAAPPGVDVVGIAADPLKAPQIAPRNQRPRRAKVRPFTIMKRLRLTVRKWWRRLIYWEPAAAISSPGYLPHVHIIPPDGPCVRYRAAIFVRVSRPGWLTASWLVALVIGAVVLAGRLNLQALYGEGASAEAGTAATLLLALLGVFAVMLAGPGEHPLASRLLLLARSLIVIDTLVVLAASGHLILHRPPPTHPAQPPMPAAFWTWLAIFSGAVAILFSIARLAPVARLPRRE